MLTLYYCIQDADDLVAQAVKNSMVLSSKESDSWDWDIIGAVLKVIHHPHSSQSTHLPYLSKYRISLANVGRGKPAEPHVRNFVPTPRSFRNFYILIMGVGSFCCTLDCSPLIIFKLSYNKRRLLWESLIYKVILKVLP